MNTKRALTRRRFLKTALKGAGIAAAAAFPTIVPSTVFGANAPSNRITMGFVGLGRGMGFVMHYMKRKDVRVLGVCDVAHGRADGVAGMVNDEYKSKGCTAYYDFRQIVARDDIDTILIYTQTHWHAIIAVAALNAGKDVFCEKPLSLTIAEGRAVCDAVKRNNRVFLAGTQYRTYPDWQGGVEVLRNGLIGKLKQVLVLGSGGIYPDVNHKLPASLPVPEGLDYDFWLGPAPEVPYFGQTVLSLWMACQDYTSGWMAEFGVHSMDNALWGYNPKWEGIVEIEGKGNYYKDPRLGTPQSFDVELRFPDGVEMLVGASVPSKDCRGFTTFVGAEGKAYMGRSDTCSTVGPFRPTSLHWRADQQLLGRDFIDCVRSRRTPYATAEDCHHATSLVILTDIAMRLGRKVKFDLSKEQFIDDATADRMLSRPMRSPWSLDS